MGAYEQESKRTRQVAELLTEADAIVVGAGSGMSAAAGFTYDGERFETYFKDFIKHYGLTDMYSAGFYPFQTLEEKWAYWSRHIYYNRYDVAAGKPYLDLYTILKERNYFVLTTNVDHQFQLTGFSEERIFAAQGDYGLFQCARACHKKLYDNEAAVRAMVECQRNFRIPEKLIPRCPVCGGAMEVNLRCDSYFVEDAAWEKACGRYQDFIKKNSDKKIVFLELGVGGNTPGIIKYPFWQMTDQKEKAHYVCINRGEAWGPKDIEAKSFYFDDDIAAVLESIRREVST